MIKAAILTGIGIIGGVGGLAALILTGSPWSYFGLVFGAVAGVGASKWPRRSIIKDC